MLSEKFLTEDPEGHGFALVSGDDEKGGEDKFADGSLSIAKAVDDDDESIRRYKDYFCFCCCDYRRAVIIVNAIALANLLLLLPLIPAYAAILIHRGVAGEDFAQVIVTVLLVTGVVFHICGIFGAKTYRPWGIRLAAVAHFANMFARCFGLFTMLAFPREYLAASEAYGDMMAQIDSSASAKDFADLFYDGMMIGSVGGILLNSFYFQAHVKLLGLMREGIITRQNYPNVSSCYCD